MYSILIPHLGFYNWAYFAWNIDFQGNMEIYIKQGVLRKS